jgi:hypothetical protein
MNTRKTTTDVEDTIREERRRQLKGSLKYWALFILFGIIGTVPFWGWILFGWLFEQFR